MLAKEQVEQREITTWKGYDFLKNNDIRMLYYLIIKSSFIWSFAFWGWVRSWESEKLAIVSTCILSLSLSLIKD